jgi:hypothetical protein
MSAAYLKASSQEGVLTMLGIKTETITLRIDPDVKGGLRTMAERERRSLANMIEIMIRDYCEKRGISISE